MSLFSTIAHPGARYTRGPSLKGLGMVAVGLALAIAAAYVIVNNRGADLPEETTAAITGVAHEDFVRLNTTEMPEWSAQVLPKAIEPQGVVDPFTYWNINSFEGLAAAADLGVDPFTYWNINSFEGLAAAADVEVDPFTYWNMHSFEGLAPLIEVEKAADPGMATKSFLEINIDSLEYPLARYSEPASGPR